MFAHLILTHSDNKKHCGLSRVKDLVGKFIEPLGPGLVKNFFQFKKNKVPRAFAS